MKEKQGKYIYGVIGASQKKNFGAIGIGGSGNEVTTLHFNDIAAVVSNHPVVEFDRLEENHLRELIVAHQRVNETVMKNFTVAPMKFGNIAESDEDVKMILERAYIQFKSVLNRVKGKVELVVQAVGNKQNWIQEIAGTDKKVVELKNALSSGSEGDNLLARIEMGKVIHEAVSSKEKIYNADILYTLRNGNYNFSHGKLLGEDMIFNGSFLVSKKGEPDFDKKVNKLAGKYEGQLNFKYVGPLPPYSFVNLKLTLTDFELIEEARKTLGLPCKATMTEIKSAYRTLVVKYHPDKISENPEAEEQFKIIAKAYHVLETFCQNYRFSFSEQVIRDTVLVNDESNNKDCVDS